MTEASGSGTTLETTSSTGTPAVTNGTAAGSTGGAADPFSGLETGTRDAIGKKGFKSVADLATGYLNAESLIGRSVPIPAADAKQEDWDKYHDRLGRPKDAAAYEFKLPDGLPKDFVYDGERAKAFKSIAHAAGLTPKQASIVHDAVTKQNATEWTALGKQISDAQVASTAALEKAYGGAKDSDVFKQEHAWVGRAVDGLDKLIGGGLQKALEGAGLLHGGMIMEPTIALALNAIGKAMFKEDGLALGTGGGFAGENPFDAKTHNVTQQMMAIRSDPDKAKRMIQAAGKTPADFGWDGNAVRM